MPVPYLKKLAKEGHGSLPELEKQWSKAKLRAAEQGHAEDYAYITSILKKMLSIKSSFFVVVSSTANDYLIRMGQQFRGLKPLSGDCRSQAVRQLLADTAGLIYQINIVGHAGERDVVHVFLTDNHGRQVKDPWNGQQLPNSKYQVTLASGTQTLDVVQRLDVAHFLQQYC